MKSIKKTFPFGRHEVTLETGEIARQADGACLVTMDDTVVLVTCVARRDVKSGQDFFPLTVDYQEKTYAAGRIPGGFFKREGRPSEKEILTSRLIDRPLRPLFPDGFFNEVQVIATVLSINPEVDSDIPAMLGASAAVTLAGLPFEGPIGAARVGYIDGEYVLNPTKTELETSKLNLVVAGTEEAVLMVESEANELAEDVMLGAVMFGHEQMQAAIRAVNELADEGGKDDWEWEAHLPDAALVEKIRMLADNELNEAYRTKSKASLSMRPSASAALSAPTTSASKCVRKVRESELWSAKHWPTLRTRLADMPFLSFRSGCRVRSADRMPAPVRRVDPTSAGSVCGAVPREPERHPT